MSMFDRKFPVAWTIWVIAILVSFAVFEAWAIATHGTTLSRYIWNVSNAWPLLPFVLGLLVGGVAVHLWWSWDPNNPKDRRR